MNYRYDLFISYKAHPSWNFWSRNLLYEFIQGYLIDALPDNPNVFIDDHTQTGENWANKLGEALGSTRVMLAVLTPPYFKSQWCVHELDLMHQRLLNTKGSGIIMPTIASGDGSYIPMEIERLQIKDLKRYRYLDLQRGTPRCQEFSQEVKYLTDEIAKAIYEAPPFDPSWELDCKERFTNVYNARSEGRRVPVTSLTLKEQPKQHSVPRANL
jgi:hypothetical protein